MNQIRGVILDVDGTLVDSNKAHALAWQAALADQGIHPTFDELYHLIGMGGDKLIAAVAGVKADSKMGQRLSEDRLQIFQAHYLPTLQPTLGAHDLLEFLHARDYQLVVASSAKDEELDPLLDICNAKEYLLNQTSSNEVKQSKPDADIVHVALDKLSMPATDVIMLGDTPYDIEAARGANVAVIAFRCGGWDDASLEGAVAIYDNPADLLEQFSQSPFGSHKTWLAGKK